MQAVKPSPRDVRGDFRTNGTGQCWLVGYREGRGDSPLPTIHKGAWLGHHQLRFLFGRHIVEVFYARIDDDQLAAERVAKQLEELGARVELFAHQALAHSYLDHLRGDIPSFDPYQRTIESTTDLASVESRLERLRRATRHQFGSVDWVDFNWQLQRKLGLVLAGEAEQVYREHIANLNHLRELRRPQFALPSASTDLPRVQNRHGFPHRPRTGTAEAVRVACVRDLVAEGGHRVLIDRRWPRGLPKSNPRFDEWLKDVAPSRELCRWYGGSRERFYEFQLRYAAELIRRPALLALGRLRELAGAGGLILVTASRDLDHSAAAVLRRILNDGGRYRFGPQGRCP